MLPLSGAAALGLLWRQSCQWLMLRPLAKCFTELEGTTGCLLGSVQKLVAVQPDGTWSDSAVGIGERVVRYNLFTLMKINGLT